MTYLEAVDLINAIEKKYDVMSIRYRGVGVWSHLRLYLLDNISVKTEIKASNSIILTVLHSVLSYNPFRLFRRYGVWLFTGCERRKRLGEKMVHRISGGLSTMLDNCLMIEKPGLTVGHYPKKAIEEKNIVSESGLIIIANLIERVLRLHRPRIENEDLLKRILAENKLSFDYIHYVRILNAKRLSLLGLMKITKPPRLALIECPYNSMGYVWAFHQMGVKCVELQHGVVGRSHNAYNANSYESILQPDCICVFGSEEYRYFTEEKPQYTRDVFMTGLYMLERSEEFFKTDIFAKYRGKYKSIIVVSGQSGFEQILAEQIQRIAENHQNLLFFYIPRKSNTELIFSSTNVQVVKDANIYEYLKWADIHITISSTSCLEAQYFRTPTIFYNYNKMATNYYGNVLNQECGAFYIDSSEAFDKAYEIMQTKEYTFKEVFVHNHAERIKSVIINQLS